MSRRRRPLPTRPTPATNERRLPPSAAARRRAHWAEITSVALTTDPVQPRIVSGSVEKSVRITDPLSRSLPIRLKHADAVRAVACSPVGAAPNVCLAGGDDGVIYVWDLAKVLS